MLISSSNASANVVGSMFGSPSSVYLDISKLFNIFTMICAPVVVVFLLDISFSMYLFYKYDDHYISCLFVVIRVIHNAFVNQKIDIGKVVDEKMNREDLFGLQIVNLIYVIGIAELLVGFLFIHVPISNLLASFGIMRDIDKKKEFNVANAITHNIFDVNVIGKQNNFLPLEKLDRYLSSAMYLSRWLNIIFTIKYFIIGHCAFFALTLLSSYVESLIKEEVIEGGVVPVEEFSHSNEDHKDRDESKYLKGKDFVSLWLLLPFVFLIFAVIAFDGFIHHFIDNTNSEYCGESYQEKVIQYCGTTLARIYRLDPKTKSMCAAYLTKNRSYSEGSDSLTDEDRHQSVSRRTVLRQEGVLTYLWSIIGGMSLFIISMAFVLWKVGCENHDVFVVMLWPLLILSLGAVIFYNKIYQIFVSANSIAYSQLPYMVNSDVLGSRNMFMKDVQISVNVAEKRVLYQAVPMVEEADDKWFEGIKIPAGKLKAFMTRYPYYDAGKVLNPRLLKSTLIECLREGNGNMVREIIRVLSNTPECSKSLKIMLGKIEKILLDAKVLLTNVNFLLDQKNGMFVHYMEIVPGGDVVDDGYHLRKVSTSNEVDEIRKKWHKNSYYGELPKYECPVRNISEDLVANKLFEGKSYAQLVSNEQKHDVSNLISKWKVMEKQGVVFILRTPVEKPYTQNQMHDACNSSNVINNIKHLDYDGYIKHLVAPRGMKILLMGPNGSGKSLSGEALVGVKNDSGSAVSRITYADAIESAFSHLSMSNDHSFVSSSVDSFKTVPLFLINKDQRNFMLDRIAVGDVMDLPGARFREMCDASLTTHLNYVEIRVRDAIKLCKMSSDDNTTKSIEIVMEGLHSAYKLLRFNKLSDGSLVGRDKNIANDISQIIVNLANKNTLESQRELLQSLLSKVIEESALLQLQMSNMANTLRLTLADALSFSMLPDDSRLIGFSTGEGAKLMFIDKCVLLAVKGLNSFGKAQYVLLNDEAGANIDVDSLRVINSWFAKPLASFGITNIEIAHHHNDFALNAPDVLLFFDTKLKTILFYYRKAGRWYSDVEFLRIGSGDFEKFHLDNGAELIVVKVDAGFNLNQENFNDLLAKLEKDSRLGSMSDITNAEKFIRANDGLADAEVKKNYSSLTIHERKDVLKAFGSSNKLFDFLTQLGYKPVIVDNLDKTKSIAQHVFLSDLTTIQRQELDEYILRILEPDYYAELIEKRAKEDELKRLILLKEQEAEKKAAEIVEVKENSPDQNDLISTNYIDDFNNNISEQSSEVSTNDTSNILVSENEDSSALVRKADHYDVTGRHYDVYNAEYDYYYTYDSDTDTYYCYNPVENVYYYIEKDNEPVYYTPSN